MKTSMVVAHVLSSFGLGGQERVALDLARLQRAAGHDVLAVSLARGPEGPLGEAFRAAGVFAETVAKGPRVDPSLPFRLALRLRHYRADVVHTHNPHALIYGAPAAWLAGAVAIHSKHGMNHDPRRRLWLRRAAAKLVDAYVAVTPALAERALEQGDCDRSLLRVISNGVDVTRFGADGQERSRVRAELGIPDGAWVVGTVGRLVNDKNQALLVDAMIPLLGEGRRLLIVGDGPERDALRTRVEGAAAGTYVQMLGARQDVPGILAALDAFALTSRTEGMPLALLEAMAAGLPVVTTAVGGIPDLVAHGVTGLLSPAGDVASFTRQLDLLSTDRALALRLADAGRREVVARYSLDRMADEYVALYEGTLRARHRVLKQQWLA